MIFNKELEKINFTKRSLPDEADETESELSKIGRCFRGASRTISNFRGFKIKILNWKFGKRLTAFFRILRSQEFR